MGHGPACYEPLSPRCLVPAKPRPHINLLRLAEIVRIAKLIALGLHHLVLCAGRVRSQFGRVGGAYARGDITFMQSTILYPSARAHCVLLTHLMKAFHSIMQLEEPGMLPGVTFAIENQAGQGGLGGCQSVKAHT